MRGRQRINFEKLPMSVREKTHNIIDCGGTYLNAIAESRYHYVAT